MIDVLETLKVIVVLAEDVVDVPVRFMCEHDVQQLTVAGATVREERRVHYNPNVHPLPKPSVISAVYGSDSSRKPSRPNML